MAKLTKLNPEQPAPAEESAPTPVVTETIRGLTLNESILVAVAGSSSIGQLQQMQRYSDYKAYSDMVVNMTNAVIERVNNREIKL